MKKIITFIACLFLIILAGNAQSEVGGEYQLGFGKPYRTSSIGSFYEGFNNTGKRSWQIGAHYTFGSGSGNGGFGFSAAYRLGFAYGGSGNLVFAPRTSFTFFNDAKSSGSVQFRPSVELGYHYTFNNFGKGGFTTPALGYGYNFRPGSEDEGQIITTRIALGYRF